MIIYSVEIWIDKIIAEEWLNWMTLQHIPEVMKTNLFKQFKMFKNLDAENTYTIQYELETLKNYLKYEKCFSPNLQKDHSKKFKGKFKG